MSRKKDFQVVKASGRTEPYDRNKILGSLRRAGADGGLAASVLEEAERSFHPGISTRKILSVVMDLLQEREERTASLYDLKGAIRRLGPAGYSFETYVGEIFREYGNSVSLRQTIQGRCASHEIDVVIESPEGRLRLVECKYRQTAGSVVDLKEMMYTWARYLDINEKEGLKRRYEAIVMASNTRASEEACRFASCRGVEVLSWKHPEGEGLEEMIKARGLYPVTILRSAAPLGSEFFSRAGLMLVKDFAWQDPQEMSLKLQVPLPRTAAIIREAGLIMKRFS